MKRRFRIQLLICLFLAALFFSRLAWLDTRGSSPTDDPYYPEGPAGPHRVVMVMVDGLRLQDSYLAPRYSSDLRAPTNYTPRLARELIPLGTLYPDAFTGAYNTITTACTNTIVTGSWNGGPNRGRGPEATEDRYVDNRSFDRTIFEVARRDLGLSEREVVFLSDKLNTRLSDYSYHPLGGPELAPSKRIFPTYFNREEPRKEETWIDPVENSDRAVYEATLEALDTLEPRLLFVGWGNVDIAGHRSTKNGDSDYRFYTRAIAIFDHLVTNLWYEIQSRPGYRGNTTMIVCSDHGRHEDHDPTAYGSHQGTCAGARNIVCLVLGPHTPAGAIIERRVYQTDLAPTVAALLGCRLPEASGQPLYEAIGLVPEVDGPRYARGLRAVLDDGTPVVTYRRAGGAGQNEIVVQRAAPDGGLEPPVVVTRTRFDDVTFHDHPALASGGGSLHLATWRWTDANHEITYFESPDGGRTFGPPRVLATGKPESSPFGEISIRPFALGWWEGRAHLIVPAVAQPGAGNESTLTHVEALRFGEEGRKRTADRIDRPRRIGHHRFLDVERGPGGDLIAAFSAMQLPTDEAIEPFRSNWEAFAKNLSRTRSEDPARRLTDNNATPEIMPAVAVDPSDAGRVAVVFAGRVDDRFQLFVAHSANGSEFGAPVRVTDSRTGAWEPDAAVHAGTLYVTFVDFDRGQGDVHWMALRDGVVVESPRNLSSSPGISRNPRLLVGPGGTSLEVLWEEEDPRTGFRIARSTIDLAP